MRKRLIPVNARIRDNGPYGPIETTHLTGLSAKGGSVHRNGQRQAKTKTQFEERNAFNNRGEA